MFNIIVIQYFRAEKYAEIDLILVDFREPLFYERYVYCFCEEMCLEKLKVSHNKLNII